MSELGWLSVQQAATETGLSQKTIYRALESRALRGAKFSERGEAEDTGTWRITPADLVAWFEASVPSAAAPTSIASRRRRSTTTPRRGSLRALAATDPRGTR